LPQIDLLHGWYEGKVPEVGALSILLALTATLFGWAFMRLSARYGARAF
jgi:ABC-type uncharacterized transport system permease subunit